MQTNHKFVACIKDDPIRKEYYNNILRQESLVEHNLKNLAD